VLASFTKAYLAALTFTASTRTPDCRISDQFYRSRITQARSLGTVKFQMPTRRSSVDSSLPLNAREVRGSDSFHVKHY